VELFEQYAESWSSASERSLECRGSWEFIGGWCERRCGARSRREQATAKALRKLVDASAFIDRILTEDRQAPVKQRHTLAESAASMRGVAGFTGSERTVRGYVHQRSGSWGSAARRYLFAELRLGVEAQVDWYESYAILMASAPSCRSSRCVRWPAGSFSPGYTHATQQAFLEATSWRSATLAGIPAPPLR